MSRLVCFTDDETGQIGTCLMEIVNTDMTSFCCETCEHNPFPGKVIPEDRVLREVTFDPCA
jgi:hypothetical protein